MSTWVALLWLILANIIWGSSHAVGKLAVVEFPPLVLAALRAVIAAGCFWGLRIGRIAPAEVIATPQRVRLAALGLIAVVAAQLFDYSGLALTTATDSALMIIGEVIFTAVLAVIISHERLGWQRSLGLAIGIVGVVVLTLGGAPDSSYAPNRALGNTLVLAALFCEALFTVLGANLAQRFHPLTVMRWTYTGSLVVWIPLLAWYIGSGAFPQASVWAWISVVALALLTTVVSYLIWFWVLRSAGAGLGAMSLFVQPVVGSVLGLLVLHEPSSPGLYIGAVLIFVALGLATIGQPDHAA